MNPTKEQIQQFISFGYATDALKFADFDCEQLTLVSREDSMAFLSSITSLVTHYARPFKRSRGLPTLEESFVPMEHLSLHRTLIEARDKAHAHLDGDFGDAAAGQLFHQVRLLKQRDSQHYWIPSRLLALQRKDLAEVQALIKKLLAKLDAETDILQDLLLPFITQLPTGLYMLSAGEPFFVRDEQNDGVDRIEQIATIN